MLWGCAHKALLRFILRVESLERREECSKNFLNQHHVLRWMGLSAARSQVRVKQRRISIAIFISDMGWVMACVPRVLGSLLRCRTALAACQSGKAKALFFARIAQTWMIFFSRQRKSSVLKFFYNFSSLTFTSRDAFKVFS